MSAHPELASQLEAQADALARHSIAAMYADPFWDARFGARGRRFAEEDGVHHVDGTPTIEITPVHLESYLDKLGEGPYRDTSIRRKVAALKVFFASVPHCASTASRLRGFT